MASYDGAVAAIQQVMRDGWTATPVSYQNEMPPSDPWPPVDSSSSKQLPWVYFEVLSSASKLLAIGGGPGRRIYQYLGLIHAHVFVAIGSGGALAQQYAAQIGELYRAQTLYNDTPPNKVVCYAPRSDGGASADDQAGYWRVTCTVPFEFYLQA